MYDKHMIYYPLSVLLLTGIRDILIISTPRDLPSHEKPLGDGSQWGISFSYAAQPKPEGLAHAFIIGRKFISKDHCCLILGDDIFYGQGLTDTLRKASSIESGATVFAYWVNDPARYGEVNFDEAGMPHSIEEKPGEIFYTLREAQILVERWRQHYNTIRPHSSLNYRPPAPEAFIH